MARKIATIVLIHDCEDDPCHLDSDNQAKWIKGLLPLDRLEWNWKLMNIKVIDVKGIEKEKQVDQTVHRMMNSD